MNKLFLSDGDYEVTLFNAPLFNEPDDSDYLEILNAIVVDLKRDSREFFSVRNCDLSQFLCGYFPDYFTY